MNQRTLLHRLRARNPTEVVAFACEKTSKRFCRRGRWATRRTWRGSYGTRIHGVHGPLRLTVFLVGRVFGWPRWRRSAMRRRISCPCDTGDCALLPAGRRSLPSSTTSVRWRPCGSLLVVSAVSVVLHSGQRLAKPGLSGSQLKLLRADGTDFDGKRHRVH